MNNDFIKLKNLQERIEQLSKFNQIEILKILHSSKVMINENKYGCHINLTEVSNEVIIEMETYLKYVSSQEIDLHHIEQQKEEFKHTFFDKKKNYISEQT
jgi:hypothetical protein